MHGRHSAAQPSAAPRARRDLTSPLELGRFRVALRATEMTVGELGDVSV
jgi:hypothetical protein